MKIKFQIKKDFSAPEEIIIDKFFQFVIVGEKVSKKSRTVNVFTALSYKTKTGNAVPIDIIQSYEDYSNNCEKNSIHHKDKSLYYQHDDILKQFWGKATTKLSNPNFSTEFKSLIKGNSGKVIDEFYRNLDNIQPLFVEESEKSIQKFFIIPSKVTLSEDNNIKLIPPRIPIPIELQKVASFGFWFHSEFSGEFKEDASLSFLHEINSDIELSCADFKVYYQTSKEHDIRSFKYALNDKPAEVIKVYSQQNTSYFDDWKKLKIYESSLLRLHNSNTVNEDFKNKGIKKIIGEIELVNYKANRKKELNTIIITMFLSLLLSLGLDATRLTQKSFNILFETTIFSTPMPTSLTWFFLCTSIIPKYYSINNSMHNIRNKIYILLSAPIFITMFLAIHFNENELFISNIKPYINNLIIMDMFFTLFLILGFIMKNKLEYTRTKRMHLKGKSVIIDKIIDKLRSFVSFIWGE